MNAKLSNLSGKITSLDFVKTNREWQWFPDTPIMGGEIRSGDVVEVVHWVESTHVL